MPMCEIDKSPSSSTNVKNVWSYTCNVPKRLHCMGRDNFTCILSLFCAQVSKAVSLLKIFLLELCFHHTSCVCFTLTFS